LTVQEFNDADFDLEFFDDFGDFEFEESNLIGNGERLGKTCIYLGLL